MWIFIQCISHTGIEFVYKSCICAVV